MSVFADLVSLLANALDPLFRTSATAAAIVLFTCCVRLALHPLTRAAVRGETARARLAPQVAELQRKHKDRPDRLRQAMAELYAKEKSSPLAGCLPMLVQLPVFFVMYRLFSAGEIGGETNELLAHRLFEAPLGGRWVDVFGGDGGGVFGGQGLVYLGLFAVIAAVAAWSYVRARRASAVAAEAGTGLPMGLDAGPGTPGASGVAGMMKLLPLLSFGTLITAAVVPLAAGLYLATTTAWSVTERAWLQRGLHARPTVAEAVGG